MIDSENLKKDLRQIQSSVQSDYDKMFGNKLQSIRNLSAADFRMKKDMLI